MEGKKDNEGLMLFLNGLGRLVWVWIEMDDMYIL